MKILNTVFIVLFAGSSCSRDSSINSSEGYMEMNPTEQSKSLEKVNSLPEGYIDMTVGSSSSTSSKGRSRVEVISVGK